MKAFLVFTLICAFSISFAQNISSNNGNEKFFISTSFNSNLTGATNLGIGLKLSVGYNINEDFSIMASSGYMTSFTNPYGYTQYRIWDSNTNDFLLSTISNGRQDHKFIPVDLTFRYNFNVLGVQTYAQVKAGWDFELNEGNYNVTTFTKYESSNQLIESTSGLANDIYNIPKTGANFGLGYGLGVLVPVTNSFKLDLSYLYLSNRGVHSIGLGLNLGIK